MKIIAFAHISIATCCFEEASIRDIVSVYKFKDLENPAPKLEIMKSVSLHHNIYLYRQNIDVEILNYNRNCILQHKSAHESVISSAIEKNIIFSSSFDDHFYSDFDTLFGLNLKSVSRISNLRTLDMKYIVEFKYSKSRLKFNKFLDEPGLVSIAFWVDSIDEYEKVWENFNSTPIFVFSVGENDFKIRFVQCGGVWIELIERPN